MIWWCRSDPNTVLHTMAWMAASTFAGGGVVNYCWRRQLCLLHVRRSMTAPQCGNTLESSQAKFGRVIVSTDVLHANSWCLLNNLLTNQLVVSQVMDCVNVKHTNLIQRFLSSSSVIAEGKVNNLYGGEQMQQSCRVPCNSQISFFHLSRQ